MPLRKAKMVRVVLKATGESFEIDEAASMGAVLQQVTETFGIPSDKVKVDFAQAASWRENKKGNWRAW